MSRNCGLSPIILVELAEYETSKRKYLYVVGTEYPLTFLTGGRDLRAS
jgi:hypothetical protein